MRHWIATVPRLAWLAVLPLVLVPLAECMMWRMEGGEFIGGAISLAVIFGFVGALVSIPVLLVLLLFQDQRRRTLLKLGCAFIMVTTTFAGFRLSLLIRNHALWEVMDRAKPLIAAIQKYETDNNGPPETLQHLSPKYFPDIPLTGVASCPNYYYRLPGTNTVFAGNSWILEIRPPVVGIGFDSFIYLPLQNYPARGWGGSLERVGNWAYVHE